MITRRSLLAATPLTLAARSHEVTIGIQSYSFRDRSLDEAIKAISAVGLREIELWSGHLEPPRGTPAAEMTRWRTAPERRGNDDHAAALAVPRCYLWSVREGSPSRLTP